MYLSSLLENICQWLNSSNKIQLLMLIDYRKVQGKMDSIWDYAIPLCKHCIRWFFLLSVLSFWYLWIAFLTLDWSNFSLWAICDQDRSLHYCNECINALHRIKRNLCCLSFSSLQITMSFFYQIILIWPFANNFSGILGSLWWNR